MSNPVIILVDAIGHEVLQNKVGLTERNIRHARSVGKFAARWYAPIKTIAEPLGVFVPLDAFSFESLANKRGKPPAKIQGQAPRGVA